MAYGATRPSIQRPWLKGGWNGDRVEQNVRGQIVDFITRTFLFDADDKCLGETDSLLESGIIDSAGVLEIIAFVEETYGIEIEDEEVVPENLDSIANIAAFVARKHSSLRTALG